MTRELNIKPTVGLLAMMKKLMKINGK